MDSVFFNRQKLLIPVDRAEKPWSQAVGLAFRRSVERGLLFTADRMSRPKIWMWGMRVPIDVIWIADSKVVKVDSNIQPPRWWKASVVCPFFLKHYTVPRPVDYILEVEAGFCEEHNLQVGDTVICE